MLDGRRSQLHALRTSLLGVPVLYVTAATAFGVLMRVMAAGPLRTWRPGVLGSDLASLLTGTATATLTMAGFVLTMATLSVQFLASTYAPRLVERLRRDALLRHTLGAGLGTFTVGFLSAFLLPESASGPIAIAASVSLIGALATVLLFVALLERITGQLRPGTMFSELAKQTRVALEGVYGERTDAEAITDEDGVLPDDAIAPRDVSGTAVRWPGHAAILLDGAFTDLVELAERDGVMIELTIPVGATLQHGAAVADVTGSGAASDGLEAEVRALLVIGPERTLDSDPAWGVRLLADAALRALSPGVNDPTTAVQVLDHAACVLIDAAGRPLGGRQLRGSDGSARVRIPAPDWPQLLSVAFDELLAFDVEPRIQRAIDHALETIEVAVPPSRRAAVQDLRERATSAARAQ